MSYQLSLKEIGHKIYFIRSHRVMLDSDLAALYEVPTKQLNLAIKRNMTRFPPDFMFRLTAPEFEVLKEQYADTKRWGGRRYTPLVFTEQGVAMLSSVLNSDRAVQVNITVMRTFVKLRELLETDKNLSKRLDQLEKKYDHQFKAVFDAIRLLMSTGSPVTQKRIKGLSKD